GRCAKRGLEGKTSAKSVVGKPRNRKAYLQKRLCPLHQRAQSLRFTWGRKARSQAYFFFAAFFLAFFFAFAMLALQFVGLVRGRSIYTRNNITSKRARK